MLPSPFPADDQFFLPIVSKPFTSQPSAHRLGDLKTGFDAGKITAWTQQAQTGCTLSAPEHGIESIEKN